MLTRRIKPVSALILTSLFALIFMSYASAQVFSEDLDAINNAAKSVLLLVVYDREDNVIGTGSGFVAFDCETLVTNNHVIEGADLILAISDAEYQYMVTKVIAADAQRDIALLEFMSPTDMMPLELFWGEDGLKRGAPVVAIGSPQTVKIPYPWAISALCLMSREFVQYNSRRPSPTGPAGAHCLTILGR